MSLKRLSDRTLVTVPNFYLCFNYRESPNDGLWFSCTEDGKLLMDEHFQQGTISNLYAVCIERPEDFLPSVVKDMSHSYWENASYECKCGNTIWIDGDTDCEHCGRLFNAFGQELKKDYDRLDAAMDGVAWDEEDY